MANKFSPTKALVTNGFPYVLKKEKKKNQEKDNKCLGKKIKAVKDYTICI